MATTTTDQEPLVQATSRPSLLKLIYSAATLSAPQALLLSEGERWIGRDPAPSDEAAPILLRSDPRASRRHACVVVRGDTVLLRDAGSRHGTWVNGVRISEKVLRDGALVRTGDSLFVFRQDVDRSAEARRSPPGLVVESTPMRRLLAFAEEIAPRSEPVLLRGETGTGKEILARHIHEHSKRQGPILAVNCATLTSELADGALFGHMKGAFTGAHRAHEGYFLAAGSGTLFLDEIGELPLPVQAKLLRALAERTVTPVGATESRPYAARILAATNRDLDAERRNGTFRADLLARINVLEIELAPLRDRREDILPLLTRLLPADTNLTCRLAEALLLHSWPLNVREVQKLATFVHTRYPREPLLDLQHLEPLLSQQHAAAVSSAADAHADADVTAVPPLSRGELAEMLTRHGGIVSRVAAEVRRSPRQVRRWMSAYRLERSECRPK